MIILRQLKEKLFLNEERPEDIKAFNDKFGKDTFDRFNKLRGRLKNNKVSVDIVYHNKNTNKEEMDKILYDAEKRIVKDDTGKDKLNRKKISENDHYVAWEVMDWETAMNMGDGTEWCISGRYETDGEVKPSQAEYFFNDYKEGVIEHFVYLIPKDNEEKYCVSIYKDGEYRFWDSEDRSTLKNRIPNDTNLNGLIIYGIECNEKEFVVEDKELVYYNGDGGDIVVPDGVCKIAEEAFYKCTGLTSITIPDSVTNIGIHAFYGCASLNSVSIGNNLTSIGAWALENCTGLMSITYKGTREQWDLISKGLCWDSYTGCYRIHCIDGDIKK